MVCWELVLVMNSFVVGLLASVLNCSELCDMCFEDTTALVSFVVIGVLWKVVLERGCSVLGNVCWELVSVLNLSVVGLLVSVLNCSDICDVCFEETSSLVCSVVIGVF